MVRARTVCKETGPSRAACQFLWITDVHPTAVVANITPLITNGAQALKKNLEKRSSAFQR